MKGSRVQVAIYARGEDREAETTQRQIEECRQLCDRLGYVIEDIFVDDPRSGLNMFNRPAFTMLLWQAMDGKFGRIIATDIFRISPDQADAAHFFKKMDYLGIKIETVRNGIITPELVGISALSETLYYKELGSRAHQAVIASVLSGSVPGGHVYGYELVDHASKTGARRIVPEQADIVRRIFKQYRDGKSLTEICHDLNREGIPAPKGGEWVPTTLLGSRRRESGMLRQTLYKGVITFNKMGYSPDPETKKRQSVVKPKSDWIRVPIPELAIVSDEEFQAVAERIEAPRNADPDQSATKKTARKPKVGGRKHAVYGGRLYCDLHSCQIKARYADKYGCEHPECANRTLDQIAITGRIVAGLARVSAKDLYKDIRDIQLNTGLDALLADLERLRAARQKHDSERRTILEAARGHIGEGVNLYLLDQVEQRREIEREIARIEADATLITYQQVRGYLAVFKRMARRLKNDARDETATKWLRDVITTFKLPGETDAAAKIEIDRQAVIDQIKLTTADPLSSLS